MYINYKCPFTGSIETVECLKGLSKEDRKDLIANYKTVAPDYYVSRRATKEYYEEAAA